MINRIRKIIEENNSIILVSHFNPDGDAYGSQMGLKDAIQTTYKNKKVYAVGSGLKQFFPLLGEMDDVSDEIIKESLIILLDANELYRFEDQRCMNGKQFMLIDHHIQSTKYDFETGLVNEQVSSTCEIVARFIKDSGMEITPKGANALFLGILTDTGRFQYSYNFAKMFEIVDYLCEKGANPTSIYQKLNVLTETDLKIRQFIFSNIKVFGKVIYTHFTSEDLDKLNTSAIYALSNVNQIANIDKYPIWMIYVTYEDGTVQFEMRSKNLFIQPVARSYGGGGHANAAGVTIKNCSQDTIDTIIKKLNEVVEVK